MKKFASFLALSLTAAPSKVVRAIIMTILIQDTFSDAETQDHMSWMSASRQSGCLSSLIQIKDDNHQNQQKRGFLDIVCETFEMFQQYGIFDHLWMWF